MTGMVGLSFLFGDHLGSTSVTANSSGTKTAEARYKAWGESRYTSGTLPTRYTYTGQYSYASDFGLVFYGSRFYDPLLARWASPDSIIPQNQGTLAWDRYSYVNNSPLNYNDPTGHKACNGSDDNSCTTEIMPDSLGNTKRLLNSYGVRLENGTKAWTLEEAQSAYWAAYNVSGGLVGQNSSDEKRSQAFRNAFDTSSSNPLKLIKVKEFTYQGTTYTAGGVTRSSHRIELASLSVYPQIREGNIVHEFGHAYNQGHKISMPQSYVTHRSEILADGYQFNTSPTSSETFADFIVAWTYNVWNDSIYTPSARQWMANVMSNP